MIELANISRVYFIGIGGIGMSALARYFHAKGVIVQGYDKTETALTRQMEAEGIGVHYLDDIGLLDGQANLVIYTPAVPKQHTELNYFREHHFNVVKRSEVLGAVTAGSFNICIAGTHGKTTISAMTAHILRDSGYGCNAFLGGIAVNYDTNFWSNGRNLCVVEADEYDRSFLQLSPDIAVISSMDPDHLDIYGTTGNMEQAFIDFAGKIKPGGTLLSRHGLKRSADLHIDRHITYHISDVHAGVFASGVRTDKGCYHFDAVMNDRRIKDMVLNMGGGHNIENALAAISVSAQLGLPDDMIRNSLAEFKGVKRRFEYIVRNDHHIYIDDYAHHPEELRALISGARSVFAGKKCTIVFQPHLYSRTRDLAKDFAESLDLADEVILLPVYPARELPIPGVGSELILENMKIAGKSIMTRDELADWVSRNRPELILTAGAGDIDRMVETIKNILEAELGK